MTKYCKNCKHFDGTVDGNFTSISCYRMGETRTDLVKGETWKVSRDAYEERNPGFWANLLALDRCGPEGKYWEQKPEEAPKLFPEKGKFDVL